MHRQGLAVWSCFLALCMGAAALAGCHADENDPKGQAEELDDPVRREHAVERLRSIYTQRLVEAKGDRTAAPIKEFVDVTIDQLNKTYRGHPEDSQNGQKILSLMSEMRDPRALPALLQALEWRAEVSEDHAVTAARTMTEIEISPTDKSEAVAKICEALKRVDGVRGVDNRMRKSFIEVLGKLKDKGATPTLVEIATRQDESQNFLFNILAAQQLVTIADPAAVDAMIKGLYLFAVDNPAMRMNDVATSALVAIGKPALEPMLKVLRGESDDANKTVAAYIAAIKRRDPEAAKAMKPRALISGEATYTLGKLGFIEALPALIEESKADDENRRFGAAVAMVSLSRNAEQTKQIVAAFNDVYEAAKKDMRPQLLVAIRHLYTTDVMPFLLKQATTKDDEVPQIRMFAYAGYALLANKAEAANLQPVIDREELFKAQLEEYLPAIAAAKECDENVDCWAGKLKSADKIVLRKAANSLARFGVGNDKAIAALVELFGHPDLEVRVEALGAVDSMAVKGSKAAVEKIEQLEILEGGRSIWNNFQREALPTRARLLLRAA
jgi:hypothetical protein